MNSKKLAIFAGLAALALAATSRATDPPHGISAATVEGCDTSCHTQHNTLGSPLTKATSNVNLCQACHSSTGAASAFPVENIDKAIPGTRGTSHNFDAATTNVSYGAQPPANAAMSLRVMGGNVVCSTCHNQHTSTSAMGGTPHTSPATKLTTLGSTGSVTSGGIFSGATAAWYLVEIQTAGNETTAKFRYSKDNGTSWFASNLTAAASVALDSGISVSFGAGSFVVNERWQFYGAWPFLRIPLDSGDNVTGAKFCRDCHSSWTMDTNGVETYDGSEKSHPVGLPLGFGGRTYDRATPLDGNGAIQGSGGADTNATNDLKFDSTNRIQCFTCHAVHFADGNTQTNDGP